MAPVQTAVALTRLHETATRALAAIGLAGTEIDIVLPILIYAQLRGSTQGLIKIVERTVTRAPDATPLKIEQPVASMIRVHGNGQIGMVVLSAATDRVIEATLSNGIALGSTVGTRSSTGAIGYYAARFAARGLIGIVMAGSPKTMAVHGGVDPVLGTNPIAIAVPWQGKSLVLDLATAAVPVFGLIAARERGETVTTGLAWDRDGRDTTDPGAALAGAIRAFGGAKGSGLALMVEVLTGALSGASLPGQTVDNRGNLVIGIDPEPLIGRHAFEQRIGLLVDAVMASRPVHAGEPVRLPGQASEARAEAAIAAGELRLDVSLWQALQALADGTGH